MDVMLNFKRSDTMKRIYQIGIMFFAAIMFSSCDDFLEKNPSDQLSEGTFYKEKSDFDKALTACYATLQKNEDAWGLSYQDCLTDNGYGYNNFYSNQTIAQGPITPTTGGIDRVYKTQYANIARYNIFLKQLGIYEGTDMDKEAYEAQVRMLRAFSYLELYKFYGEVPLVLEPLTYETQDQPKSSMEVIYGQVMEDVDFAIQHLPAISYKDNSGRFVKTAAQLLKARALIYNAYDDNGVAKQDIMTQVKQLTEEIIHSGFYSIAPTYRGLFCDDLGEQSNNPEFIFSVNFLAPLNCSEAPLSFGVFHSYMGIADLGGGLDPYENLVKEYDFIDGTSFSTANPLYDPNDIYKNRDPRLRNTMFSGTAIFEKGYTYTPKGESLTGYYLWKIISENDALDPYANNNSSDWPKMRYAEVLLMYAEAANEVDGPTADVYNAINQIRNRSDVNMPDLPAGYTKEQMRNKIRQERRIELSFEGFRYDDLKRWKIAEEKLNFSAEEGVTPHSFEKKNYHWPIPQGEIDKSKGVLVQNPDYK